MSATQVKGKRANCRECGTRQAITVSGRMRGHFTPGSKDHCPGGGQDVRRLRQYDAEA